MHEIGFILSLEDSGWVLYTVWDGYNIKDVQRLGHITQKVAVTRLHQAQEQGFV